MNQPLHPNLTPSFFLIRAVWTVGREEGVGGGGGGGGGAVLLLMLADSSYLERHSPIPY